VTTLVLGPTTTSTERITTRAYVYAIDPTPAQANHLRSHIGGSRFAYNTLLGLVKGNWDENRAKKEAGAEVAPEEWVDTSHFGLLYLWAERREELAPWWTENGSSTYNDATQRLAKSFTNFRKGRARFPTFKSKGQGGSVWFMGPAVRLVDSHHVRLSRIGEVTTDESMRTLHRHLERGSARIPSVTVIERGGTYTLSFTAEMSRVIPAPRPPERVIGIDVGDHALHRGYA
jgi:putative transposase